MTTLEASTGPGRRRLPPGPRGHPVLGSLPEMRGDPLGFNLRLQREYGDVVRVRLALWTSYGLTHPDHAQHVLQANHLNFDKRTFGFDLLRWILGNGLVVSQGSFWLRQRRLMQPAFHRQRVAAFGALMTQATQEMLGRWRKPGAPLDVSAEMMRLTLRIAGLALFSRDLTGDASVVGDSANVLLHFLIERFYTPLVPIWLPTPGQRRAMAARRAMEGVVRRIIQERRRSKERPEDLLTMLLQARDPETGQGMSDAQLHDEVVTLLIAGHETTANLLSWAFYLLSRHPEVERRLLEEYRRVLDGRPPTVEDLAHLPYGRMVLEETLRLYPPAWGLPRASIGEDEIGGYPFPARTQFWLPVHAIHRHPDFWENPEGFDPDRFGPERAEGRHRFAFLPFGGGPRLCIGSQFALTEAQLILATILVRCRLSLVPGHPVEPDPTLTLRPKHGVAMTVHPR